MVAECRNNIASVYALNGMSKEDIQIRVEQLLNADRFICRGVTRDVSKVTCEVGYPILTDW